MKPEFQNFLGHQYRKMFENFFQKTPTFSGFCGIDCGDGWFDLLSHLCGCIHSYCKDNKKPEITITQIKEKFGSLRFYYDGGDELISGMVWLAEYQSHFICEGCGTPAIVSKNKHGWLSTNCKKCAKNDS
jgi:hypothetical protein